MNQNKVSLIIFSCLVCLFIKPSLVLAGVDKNLPLKDLNDTITEGAFKGGQAGDGFSLLNFTRVVSASKKSERVIFEIGDKNGVSYSGKPGYFHAQLTKLPPEFTIDFSQMGFSKVDKKKFIQEFRKSKIIKKIDLNIDNQDNSTNLTIKFKKPLKVRVYTLSPSLKSPKIVVDFISI